MGLRSRAKDWLQVCLAALLAHVGAYVPAKALELSPVDAIFVRMGAKDSIVSGQVNLRAKHGKASLMSNLFQAAPLRFPSPAMLQQLKTLLRVKSHTLLIIKGNSLTQGHVKLVGIMLACNVRTTHLSNLACSQRHLSSTPEHPILGFAVHLLCGADRDGCCFVSCYMSKPCGPG